MDFVNKTKFKAGWTMGFDRDGRELVIIAVKVTFTIPQSGQEAKLAEEQAPLVEADVFTGEPAFEVIELVAPRVPWPCSGTAALNAHESANLRPVLVPPCTVRPLRSRAFTLMSTPCQYCVCCP